MTTLFIDRKDAILNAEAGALVVRGADGTLMRAPLALLERVVLRGPARIGTAAIAALHAQGAGLLILSGRHGAPSGMLLGQPASDVLVRLGQARLALDAAACAAVARRIVRAKLLAQARLLRSAQSMRPDRGHALRVALSGLDAPLSRLRQEPSLGVATIIGLEGAAAAAYFPAFAALFPPSLGFTERNRRPPRDPVNAVLSLAYTLGTFEAAREAWFAGLDPMVGFLHAPLAGRESLACDLVEPLRPTCDRLVWRLFATEQLRAAHFTRDGATCLLGKAGRATFYAAWEEAVGPARLALRRGLRPLRRLCQAAAGGEDAAAALS